MKAGHWGLVESNDPTFVWDFEPLPDPTFNMSEEEQQVFYETHTDETARLDRDEARFAEIFHCSPLVGWRLVESCIKAGFDPKKYGNVSYWLLNYLGQHIRSVSPVIEL